MTKLRSTRIAVMAISVVAATAACSGSDGSGPAANDVGTAVVQPTSTAAASSTTPSTTAPGDGTSEAPSLLELRSELALDIVVLKPTTEAGSHPTLSWQPAQGASSYWLVLRDGDGRPYWAWTGTDTSVRVGGGNRSDANQTAVLHEAMTWSVAAFDKEGNLIALSETAALAP